MRPEHFYMEKEAECSKLTRKRKEWDQDAHTGRQGSQGQSEQVAASWAEELACHPEGTWEPSAGCEQEWQLRRGYVGRQRGQEKLGSAGALETEASAALPAPGTQWAGSNRWSCRGCKSQLPPRRHSWRGQAPQTCPAGWRRWSEPNTAQKTRKGRCGREPWE